MIVFLLKLEDIVRALALVVCCTAILAPATTWAQWQWLDSQGQKVFSDRPPSNDVPEKNILQRPKPNQLQDATKVVPTAASAPVAATRAPASVAVDKNKTSAQDQALQLAEQNKAIRARNCAAAQRQLAALKSGGRVARINDKGEREFLEDGAIAAEIKQTQRVADSECQ